MKATSIPTTCPDCKAENQYDQFCRWCQQHFGPNTNRPCPVSWIHTARKVVERKQFAYVDRNTGASLEIEASKVLKRDDVVLLDMFTASVMVQIYDALSPEAQAKYREFDVVKAADTAFRILRRIRNGKEA